MTTLYTQITQSIDLMGSQPFIDNKIELKLPCDISIAIMAITDRTMDQKPISYLRFKNYNYNTSTLDVAGLIINKVDSNSQDNHLSSAFQERLKTAAKVYLTTLASYWRKCSEEEAYYSKRAGSDEIRCQNTFHTDPALFDVLVHGKRDLYCRDSMLRHIAEKRGFKGKIISLGNGHSLLGKPQDLQSFLNAVQEECLAPE